MSSRNGQEQLNHATCENRFHTDAAAVELLSS